jgi:hypothetical protein
MNTLTTAQDIATRFESLSAIDDGQQWAEWCELYAAIRDRGDTVTLQDIVNASKSTRYPMAQSTVQDCALAAGFTSNPHAVDVLTERYAGKRPVRVHSMIRAALVAIGKGGTGSVRELSDGLAGDLATIDAGKKKDKASRVCEEGPRRYRRACQIGRGNRRTEGQEKEGTPGRCREVRR